MRRSRKPVWAVSSIEGSNPSLSAERLKPAAIRASNGLPPRGGCRGHDRRRPQMTADEWPITGPSASLAHESMLCAYGLRAHAVPRSGSLAALRRDGVCVRAGRSCTSAPTNCANVIRVVALGFALDCPRPLESTASIRLSRLRVAWTSSPRSKRSQSGSRSTLRPFGTGSTGASCRLSESGHDECGAKRGSERVHRGWRRRGVPGAPVPEQSGLLADPEVVKALRAFGEAALALAQALERSRE